MGYVIIFYKYVLKICFGLRQMYTGVVPSVNVTERLNYQPLSFFGHISAPVFGTVILIMIYFRMFTNFLFLPLHLSMSKESTANNGKLTS